jgi:hypothetical protein
VGLVTAPCSSLLHPFPSQRFVATSSPERRVTLLLLLLRLLWWDVVVGPRVIMGVAWSGINQNLGLQARVIPTYALGISFQIQGLAGCRAGDVRDVDQALGGT